MEEAKASKHHVFLVSFGTMEVDIETNGMLRYEELKQDQEGMVRKIADFIGYRLSEDQIQVKFLKQPITS